MWKHIVVWTLELATYYYALYRLGRAIDRWRSAKREAKAKLETERRRTAQAWANALYYMKEIYFPDIEEQLIPTPTEEELFRLYNLQAEEKESKRYERT